MKRSPAEHVDDLSRDLHACSACPTPCSVINTSADASVSLSGLGLVAFAALCFILPLVSALAFGLLVEGTTGTLLGLVSGLLVGMGVSRIVWRPLFSRESRV